LKNEKEFISELKPIFDKITEQDFHSFLIQQIFFFGQSLEKLNHLHNSFGEEEFRDYFLPHLTQISKKHIATGETFNKKGRTDILIQDMNATNTFVAECKLWKGKSYLSSAINQLIERYVLWRDEKIAVIIFNKDNKDFTKVIEIAKETIEEHELFESFIEEKFKTIITYKFKHSEDITKIVTLELILFNCYKNNYPQQRV
jgi:phosphomevalonate kinase